MLGCHESTVDPGEIYGQERESGKTIFGSRKGNLGKPAHTKHIKFHGSNPPTSDY